MNVVIVFAVLGLALFAVGYVSKRKFGVLGLALAAGSVLSGLWSVEAGLIVQASGLLPNGALATGVTLAAVTLLPAVVLLFHGPRHNSVVNRLLSALFFALLGLAFLVTPLGPVFGSAHGVGAVQYHWLESYHGLVISVGLVLAVIDVFLLPAHHEKSKSRR